MANIKKSAEELIGRTPLMELVNYEKAAGVTDAVILAKLEYFNPAGSVKDRIALQMILDAEEQGLLKPGATIIEPTSGNTGIGLAAMAAAKGYKAILTLPETMSVEAQAAEGLWSANRPHPGAEGMKEPLRAEELHSQIPGSFIPGQFEGVNASAQTYYRSEIWDDTDGNVDIFVAGVGTGGTLTGVGSYLKEKNPAVRVVAVEPAQSAVLSGKKPGPHAIQGIGAGFIPGVLDQEIYDEIIQVENEDAYVTGRAIAQTQGLLTGISSGAALYAATLLAKRPENKGKVIVALLPDSGDRYLSTPLFGEE
ncbi:MAG: cysteine synthase A [Eisenbergiella massiliensis]